MQTPYQILGDEGIQQLSEAFYAVMDEAHEAVGIRRMHAEDLTGVTEKLTAYLTGWMGGPPHYADKYGTVCLTTPHEPYAIGPKERDQWLQCMDKALDNINASDELKDMLKEPMYRVADTVRNLDFSPDDRKDADPNLLAIS